MLAATVPMTLVALLLKLTVPKLLTSKLLAVSLPLAPETSAKALSTLVLKTILLACSALVIDRLEL